MKEIRYIKELKEAEKMIDVVGEINYDKLKEKAAEKLGKKSNPEENRPMSKQLGSGDEVRVL